MTIEELFDRWHEGKYEPVDPPVIGIRDLKAAFIWAYTQGHNDGFAEGYGGPGEDV